MKIHYPLALVAMMVLPAAALAHGAARAHSHSDNRITPRDARSHETGQLPVAGAPTTLPDSAVSMTISGRMRVFTANGIPDHARAGSQIEATPTMSAHKAIPFRCHWILPRRAGQSSIFPTFALIGGIFLA